MRVCVYFSNISSLRHIYLNSIDVFCLHIFILICSSCRMDIVLFGRNWPINFP